MLGLICNAVVDSLFLLAWLAMVTNEILKKGRSKNIPFTCACCVARIFKLPCEILLHKRFFIKTVDKRGG